MDVLVSFETVGAAAAALAERGERVSVAAVRRELGGGSPNAVLGHLRQVRAGEDAAARQAPRPAEPDDGLARPESPEVAALGERVMTSVTEVVGRLLAAERASGEDHMASLRAAHAAETSELGRVHAEAVKRLDARFADADAELTEALPAVAEVEVLRKNLATAEAAGTGLAEQVARLEGVLAAVRLSLGAATTAAERADAEAAAWRAEVAAARAEAAVTGTALDAVRTELGVAVAYAATGRVELAAAAARLESLEREAARERASAERERSGREAAEAKVAALVERAAVAEATLAVAAPGATVPAG